MCVLGCYNSHIGLQNRAKGKFTPPADHSVSSRGLRSRILCEHGGCGSIHSSSDEKQRKQQQQQQPRLHNVRSDSFYYYLLLVVSLYPLLVHTTNYYTTESSSTATAHTIKILSFEFESTALAHAIVMDKPNWLHAEKLHYSPWLPPHRRIAINTRSVEMWNGKRFSAENLSFCKIKHSCEQILIRCENTYRLLSSTASKWTRNDKQVFERDNFAGEMI